MFGTVVIMRGPAGVRTALGALATVALAMVVTVASLVFGASAASAQDVPPPPLPKAYVLVDVDTGNVLAGQDARQARYPASTIKLFTALIAAQRLPAGDVIPISSRAESMPARKMNVKVGQLWTLSDLMYAMLMVSANDAAVAIAERIGDGSLDGWTAVAQETAERLGLADRPVLSDPAGLDDLQFSNGGGSIISARDLAIVGRAVLARPDLMAMLQTPHYEFIGGDNIGHKLTNQDLFLSLYSGATGMKTGATDKAGRTFVGSATREGRTMLVVVIDAVDPLRSAALLLDQGFATPVASEPTTDVLPPVVPDAALTPIAAPADEVAAGSNGGTGSRSGSSTLDSPPVAFGIFVLGLVLLVLVRRAMLDHFEQQQRERFT